MMSWRYGIFSLLLFVAVLVLAQKNYEVWTRPLETLQEEGGVRKTEPRVEAIPATATEKEALSIASAIAISEKNIFNPDRKEFPIVTPPGLPAPGQPKPVARPQIILYGVTIAQDYQAASLVQPGRPLRKGEREMITLKIGEKVAGEYKLTKILPDRITLESSEDTFEVLLYDATAPKKRTVVRTEVRPPQVTTTLPTAPAPVGPPPAPVAVPAPAAVPPPAPLPSPIVVPRAVEAPKPGEPPGERVMEPPLPRPVTPTPLPSYPSTLRGRRPAVPYPPPESSQ